MSEKLEYVPGKLVIGLAYYIESHAYHHYIGIVVAVTPRLVTLDKVIRVQSSTKAWGEFFATGLGSNQETNCQRFPDGSSVPYDLGFFPWHHPTLPKGMK